MSLENSLKGSQLAVEQMPRVRQRVRKRVGEKARLQIRESCRPEHQDLSVSSLSLVELLP